MVALALALDTHFPREDKRKVSVMLKIVKAWKPNHITFLGDLDDMEAPSRWADGTKEEVEMRLSKTLPTVNKFLYQIRELAPMANIDWFMGNHEHRIVEYVRTKAKALEGFVNYDLLYPTKDLGITWYPYTGPPIKKFGEFYVHHGSAISQHSADSGKKELDKYGISGFSGHTHRLGAYYKTTMGFKGEWYECGHLSDVSKQTYATQPNWQHGFAYAYVDGNVVYPTLTAFRGNKALVDGKLFQ